MLQENITGDKVSFTMGPSLCLQGKTGAFRIAKQTSRASRNATHFKCQFHIKRQNKSVLTFWQTFHNSAQEPVGLTDIHLWQGQVTTQGRAWQAAHTELFRTDHYFEGYSAYKGNLLEPLQHVNGVLGLSEDSPFPGLAITHAEHGTLLIATLTQNRCKPVFDLSHRSKKINLTLREHFSGIPHINIPAGQTFSTEKWIVIHHPGSLEDALDVYFQKLRATIKFPGEKSILNKAVVWGSWNYNSRERGHGDITHDYIAQNAKALGKLVTRKPAFIMIDDGYQRDRSTFKTTRGLFASSLEFFYPSPDTAHDPRLFPKGMKGVADAIRKAGVRPALWMTPRLDRQSQLARENPHWLIQLDKGYDYSPQTAFLDYSLPQVQNYFHLVWDTIFNVWGFDGVKVDFWTMAYEIPGLRFGNQDYTAIQLRQQFLKDLRAFIPKDGFVLAACAVNSGNPFIGQYVDAVRTSIDLGGGDLHHIIQAATAMTGIIPYFRHNNMLPDADSIGRRLHNPENHNRLWATLATLVGGMCEIAGDLTNLDHTARDFFHHVIRFHQPAVATRLDMGSRSQNTPPNYLRRECQDGSAYEAYFNWQSMRREIKLPQPATDLWTGQRIKNTHMIPPFDAILIKRPK